MQSQIRTGLLLLGLGLAGPALAQTAPVVDMMPAPALAPHGKAMMAPEQRAQWHEERLTALRGQLRITLAQTAAWDGFAEVARGNALVLHQRFVDRAGTLGTLSAADNMADYARIATLHAAELTRLSEAFRRLFDSLSPEQRQIADVAFRQQREMGSRRHS